MKRSTNTVASYGLERALLSSFVSLTAWLWSAKAMSVCAPVFAVHSKSALAVPPRLHGRQRRGADAFAAHAQAQVGLRRAPRSRVVHLRRERDRLPHFGLLRLPFYGRDRQIRQRRAVIYHPLRDCVVALGVFAHAVFRVRFDRYVVMPGFGEPGERRFRAAAGGDGGDVNRADFRAVQAVYGVGEAGRAGVSLPLIAYLDREGDRIPHRRGERSPSEAFERRAQVRERVGVVGRGRRSRRRGLWTWARAFALGRAWTSARASVSARAFASAFAWAWETSETAPI